MSRVGQTPVVVPDGVTIDIKGQQIKASGKLGDLSIVLMDEVEAKLADGVINFSARNSTTRAQKMWGTARSLVSNIVVGVSEGYTRSLVIHGVGYRAQLQGKELVLQLGYSHEIRYPVAAGISIECPDQTHIVVKGADKQQVGQEASNIRAFRPPEPYKGKGIKYADEMILRKEGKKK